MIVIYTDGSASKNGSKNSRGGFGVVVLESKDDTTSIIELKQESTVGTTNNREEMKAILWALRHYGDESHRTNGFSSPIVYSDSMYCVNSFTNWIQGWKSNGWVRAGGKKLENLDLIQEYNTLVSMGYMIDLRYIKGHAGKEWNELADKLATGALDAEEVMRDKEKGCYEL